MIFENGERIIIYFILKLFSSWLEVLGDSWWWLLVMEMLLLCWKINCLLLFGKIFMIEGDWKLIAKKRRYRIQLKNTCFDETKKKEESYQLIWNQLFYFSHFLILKINANWLKKNEIKLIIEKIVFMNAYIFLFHFLHHQHKVYLIILSYHQTIIQWIIEINITNIINHKIMIIFI